MKTAYNYRKYSKNVFTKEIITYFYWHTVLSSLFIYIFFIYIHAGNKTIKLHCLSYV